MKKIQVMKRYTDMQLNRKVVEGEVLTVSDERAAELLGAQVGVVIETLPEDAVETAKTEEVKEVEESKDVKAPLKAPKKEKKAKKELQPTTPSKRSRKSK